MNTEFRRGELVAVRDHWIDPNTKYTMWHYEIFVKYDSYNNKYYTSSLWGRDKSLYEWDECVPISDIFLGKIK